MEEWSETITYWTELSFTKKATEEMSQRLENEGIEDVEINTFHSFAKSILEENVLESGLNISSGEIEIVDNSFNLIYAKNGMGKTSIMKALKAKDDLNSLTLLK